MEKIPSHSRVLGTGSTSSVSLFSTISGFLQWILLLWEGSMGTLCPLEKWLYSPVWDERQPLAPLGPAVLLAVLLPLLLTQTQPSPHILPVLGAAHVVLSFRSLVSALLCGEANRDCCEMAALLRSNHMNFQCRSVGHSVRCDVIQRFFFRGSFKKCCHCSFPSFPPEGH